MNRDRHEQDEQHRVARHLETEVNQRLHRQRQESGHRADPQPVDPRVVGRFPESGAHRADEHPGDNQNRQPEQHAALGGKLQVVVVRFDDMYVGAAGLIREHGNPVGVPSGARDRKIADDTNGVPPDRDAPADVGPGSHRELLTHDIDADPGDGHQGHRDQGGPREKPAGRVPRPTSQAPGENGTDDEESGDPRDGQGEDDRYRHREEAEANEQDRASFTGCEPEQPAPPPGPRGRSAARESATQVTGGQGECHHQPAGQMILVDQRRRRERFDLARPPEPINQRATAGFLHDGDQRDEQAHQSHAPHHR